MKEDIEERVSINRVDIDVEKGAVSFLSDAADIEQKSEVENDGSDESSSSEDESASEEEPVDNLEEFEPAQFCWQIASAMVNNLKQFNY